MGKFDYLISEFSTSAGNHYLDRAFINLLPIYGLSNFLSRVFYLVVSYNHFNQKTQMENGMILPPVSIQLMNMLKSLNFSVVWSDVMRIESAVPNLL